MKLQRLMKMKPEEIAFRSRQQAFRTMERLSQVASQNGHQPPCLFNHLKPEAGCATIVSLFNSGAREEAAEGLLQRFQTLAPARFFPGASDSQLVDLLSSEHAQARVEVIQAAEAVCEDQFSILGYGRVSFGSPVDWHLDPISGRRSPMQHWSRLNPLDSELVGDSKVTWELSRHQWMLELGQAYRFTGEERYAEKFAELLRAWMQSNPPGMGINWSSALEAAMRVISWCWALMLFKGSQALSASLFVDILAWLRVHAGFIERNLSYYFSPNTHLTGEALGLFYVGCLFPEMKGADRWRKLGVKILEGQLSRQIHADGVYFEQSTRYQYYTLEIYLHFYLLARRNGHQISDELEPALQGMLDFLLAMRRPDGNLPAVGDADGGWLLPMLRRHPDDYSSLFSTGAVLFSRNDYAWAAGRPDMETLWLCGSLECERFASLEPAAPKTLTPQVFAQGGYVIMRSGWEKDAHQLIFDCGPLGCSISAGHGHADLLSIQCSVFGESYLVDAGTGCYTADDNWREYFRSTAAHSTVMVDGQNQAMTVGPFAWLQRPAAKLEHCDSSTAYQLADASHGAYHRLDDPVTHRRRVVFVKSRYWLIIDDLHGGELHQLDLRFQFAPLPVRKENCGWVRARGRNGHALLLRAFSTDTLDIDICSGVQNPPQGWVSPAYGQREPAPVLVYTSRTRLPRRIVTLLCPAQDPDSMAPLVTPLIENGVIAGLTFGSHPGETVRISDEKIVIE